jgi:hypothetical protein
MLTLKVRDDLVLNAGTLIESANEVEILPPEKTDVRPTIGLADCPPMQVFLWFQ